MGRFLDAFAHLMMQDASRDDTDVADIEAECALLAGGKSYSHFWKWAVRSIVW